MSYHRVIPRDLFNEGDLLVCLGRLCIKLGDRRQHSAFVAFDAGARLGEFAIRQDQSDGSIYADALALFVGGKKIPHFRPLNARDKWPLWVRADEDDVRVFDLDGELSPEFLVLIGDGVPA